MTTQKAASKTGVSRDKLRLMGVILLVCSVFGIVEIIFHTLAIVLLGNPAANTTGRAVVNAVTIGSGALGVILGITLVVLGTARRS